jgi:lantibiotic modifying enzyme
MSRELASAKPSRCGIGCDELATLAVQCVFSALLSSDLEPNFINILEHRLTKLLGPGGSNEWLYGCAGTLYLLRMVKHWAMSTSDRIIQLQKRFINHMLNQGPPWVWHGKNYLGAVHGDIGIITQIVLSDPSYAPKLSSDLSSLLDMQIWTGNWPSSKSSHHNDLVQFCHGAPGIVVSLSALRPHFPSLHTRIDSSIERARQCIWKSGLLVKEPNLCHGITGNALALLGEQRAHFMALTATDRMTEDLKRGVFIKGNDPWGLFLRRGGQGMGLAGDEHK